MIENQLKVDRELKYSLEFFCEGLQNEAKPYDLLERFDHYFQMYCNHFELAITTWYDLKIAIRDAQIYLIKQPQFVLTVSTPFFYMQNIDLLDGIVSVFQRCAQARMETKK